MEKYWTTRKGQKLLPSNFEDRHLLNTLRLIERQAPLLKAAAESAHWKSQVFLQSEMALYYAEQDQRRLEAMSLREFLTEYYPIYNDLRLEAQKRGLKWESLLD